MGSWWDGLLRICMSYAASSQAIQLLILPIRERLLWTLGVISVSFTGFVLWQVVKWVEWYQQECIIPYTIVVPTPPEDRTVLEKPSIKVRGLEKPTGFH